MSIKDILSRDESFRYSMLGRLQSDCEYFLSVKNVKDLWALDVEKQIEYMKAIYDSFPKEGKPEWITKEKIQDYAKQMRAIVKNKS